MFLMKDKAKAFVDCAKSCLQFSNFLSQLLWDSYGILWKGDSS